MTYAILFWISLATLTLSMAIERLIRDEEAS